MKTALMVMSVLLLFCTASIAAELNKLDLNDIQALGLKIENDSRGLNSQVTGHSDWRSIQTPFIFKKGQKPDKLTLNLIINGIGTVWIDDIILSKAPLK